MLKETKPTNLDIWCSEMDIVVRVYCPCGLDHVIGMYDIDVKQVCDCGIAFIVDSRITVRKI